MGQPPWDPGTDPVYWVQVGGRLYHRNDLMRQAIELERWPTPDMPRLDLSLVLSTTENGTPCYVAVPAAGEDAGSGTISSTLPTVTTDFSTPDPTLAQDGSLSGKGYAKGGAADRGRAAAGGQTFTAGIFGGPGQMATNALQAFAEAEADEHPAETSMTQQVG